ncbi:MAG: hypothetical protein ACJZ4J_03940 [Candidatus Poseidoniales archaeon]
MTVPDPESSPESEDGEVDPFAELGVEATASAGSVSDGLEAFMEDDDEGEDTTEPGSVELESEEEGEDDEDMFATLGVAGPAVSLASSGEDDILAAFMDEEEESQEPEVEEESKPVESAAQPDAMEAYRMVLDTVWVDGILDPGEVNLLARKREDLGISFEEHLALVRDMLG